MKLVELKCKNCGAQLKVNEEVENIKCDYCGHTFSISSAYNEGYNYTKGVLKAEGEQREKDIARAQQLYKNSSYGKFSKLFPIIWVVIFLIIISFFGFVFYNIITDFKGFNEISPDSFNSTYEIRAGKTNGTFLSDLLDEVVTNNKTNKEHKITVIYGDISSMEEDKIKEIRNTLDDFTDYDVSLDYASDGYVDKITISNI